MSSTDFADALRVVAFATSGGTLLLTLLIVKRYYQSARRYPRRYGRGLLLNHVLMIGASYLLMTAITVFRSMGHIHQPFSIYQVGLVFAYVLGNAALLLMLRWQGHREVPGRP